MRYCISIDWLSLFCYYPTASADWQGVSGRADTIDAAYPWRYRVADYGTRQFKRLINVDIPNEQGGWDEFAEVQAEPASRVLDARSMMVRIKNRVLYRPDMWDLIDLFLYNNDIEFRSISRIDICADFNDFATLSPKKLIEGFAAKKYRHVGRGVGQLSFNHGVFSTPDHRGKAYGVNYTGLSFGTHSSDARVYLYNKSFELLTQGDKPYIRDRWKAIGLNVSSVWRLEVSIKAKATVFKDGLTKAKVTIDTTNARSTAEYLPQIYHSFVNKMFSFVVNREGITNITREPRIRLFNGTPIYMRHSLRNISNSSRTERIIIKALWNIGDTYRGAANDEVQDLAQSFAIGIADSTDLGEWLSKHVDYWQQKTHK